MYLSYHSSIHHFLKNPCSHFHRGVRVPEARIRYSIISWWPPNAAICKAFQPSLFASFVSAPNFTNSFTSFRLPSMQLWWRAVCPSVSYEFTLIFSSRASNIFWSSSVSPFRTASRKNLWKEAWELGICVLFIVGREIQTGWSRGISLHEVICVYGIELLP